MCVLIHNQDNNMQIIKIFRIFKKSGDKVFVFECDRFFVLPLFVLLRQYHYIITIIIVNGEKNRCNEKRIKN